eukprot:3379426-Pleurochrysis_carterae.AAC.2
MVVVVEPGGSAIAGAPVPQVEALRVERLQQARAQGQLRAQTVERRRDQRLRPVRVDRQLLPRQKVCDVSWKLECKKVRSVNGSENSACGLLGRKNLSGEVVVGTAIFNVVQKLLQLHTLLVTTSKRSTLLAPYFDHQLAVGGGSAQAACHPISRGTCKLWEEP